MNRRQLSAITFLVLFVVLLYLIGQILKPFFTPILWATIIATLTYPLYQRVLRWTRCRQNVSAALVTLLVVFLAILPAAYITYLGVQETIAAYKDVTEWVEAGGLKRVPELVARLPLIGDFSQELIGGVVVAAGGTLQGSILEGGKSITGFLIAQLGNVAKNTVEIVTDFLIMLFTLFFLLRDGHHLYGALYDAIPLDPDHKAAIAERLNSTVGAVVKGTLLTALAQGAVAGVTYWLLGIPFPVFLGGLSALLALLPVGGTSFVWGPLAVYLFFTAPVWKGIVLIAVGAGLVGLMDNILQPWLIGRKAELPMLFLFFATIGGIAYFGVVGLFLGPIILGILLAAFQIYREEFQSDQFRVVRPATEPASQLDGPNGAPSVAPKAVEQKSVAGR
jgi:predicted PurR-regulated permease PerM